MRLSSKLFLGILFIAVMTSGATGSYFYFQAKNAMMESIGQQLRATAKMAALLVDGDVLRELTEPEQMSTPQYLAIQDVLGTIAQSNGEFLYAYTMRLDQGTVRFIVDSPASDDDGDGVISESELPEPIGAVYPDPPREMLHGFVRASSDRTPYQDEWGVTMSGYAPVHDQTGSPVAVIGVDMDLARVDGKLAAIRQAGLISLGIAVLVALFMGWYFSRRIFQPLARLQYALARVGTGDYSYVLDESGQDEVAASARTYNAMLQELKEKAWMKASLGKVLGTQAARQLLRRDMQLGGEMHCAAILVCDLRGFTRLSEKLPPKLLVGLLNEYFTAMVEIIQKHGGMVDKFVGDMILAVFGHPVALQQPEQTALNASRELLTRCDELNQQLQLSGDLQLENSVGLHAGSVLAGYIGSPERMEYTVMGLTVNVTVRLEKATRTLDTRLAASAAFVAELPPEEHGLSHAGSHVLPGIENAMELYVLNEK